jgi:hypothetical protein
VVVLTCSGAEPAWRDDESFQAVEVKHGGACSCLCPGHTPTGRISTAPHLGHSAQEGLTIHPETHPHPVTEAIPFLGFTIFPQRRRLKRRKGIYFQCKLRAMMAAYHAEEMPLSRVSASVQGWVNHVCYGNTVRFRKAVLGRPYGEPLREI